ncbi:hypothetical protein Nmel_009482 [Mimus melanotis]
MDQAPAQMGEEAVRWAKLIIPLVVHSAHKVQLRGATALEMGMPLLLQKQQEVAAVTEHLMTTKLIAELQKLFSAKNETFVLKLWPLFVRLLGKTLHRSGSFINSLLQLEELGFRSGSPVVKKIAFIAWKSLIDNFALNPDILCSAKRLKLLMQPLSSIHVRTEALALTKLEVWWYLLMRLGPHLPSNFEQVCVPLIQSSLSVDPAAAFPGTPSRPSNPNLGSATPGQKSGALVCVPLIQSSLSVDPAAAFPGTPSRPSNPNLGSATPGQKSGPFPFVSPGTPRMALNSSTAGVVLFPSIQLLGIEMLLHFLMGPQVVDFAKQNKLVLSLEPLQYPLISSPSFFCKHASTLINAVQDGFVGIGKEVPDCLLNVIWKDINGFVKTAIEAGNKKEKQGSEILTMLLQALKNIVRSNSLPVQKILSLIDITVKELPPKVLGSPAYQVADMDLLNGTPALFLIQLPFHNNLLEDCVTDERFFGILESLVGFALSGPTSALAFSESVLCVMEQSAGQLGNKEHLCRMWSIVVNPLTEWINQATLKSLLHSWSDLYRAFARCAALVATAEENLCCEELCAKILSGLEGETPVSEECAVNSDFWSVEWCGSVLSQAKKKIPLLLPGFESIEMSEECSDPFSDMMENSQLDANISGMEVKVGQKRDSLLAQTSEPKKDGKDKSSNVQATPAKLKLEFSSPKTTSETLLEEEKSVDFVFIPPETKPRILTEHQKEVLRSKRADIPAMYNNLDASQDTTSFSQYTQSQEDSLEVPPSVENAKEDTANQAQEEKAGSEGCQSEESPACSSEEEAKNETAELIPEETSTGEGLETNSMEAASQEASAEKEDTSNVTSTSSSASSDIISGTPQPVSRRQSFITLEKFGAAESRAFSPAPLSSALELPGTAPEAATQDSSSGSKGSAKAEKPAEENKTTPRCEPAVVRRVTRRQSRMELQDTKSKLQGSSEESLASGSLEGSAELGSAVEDVEHILLSQSQALLSAEADIQKAEAAVAEMEKSRELDMDSKENTPPESSSCSEQAPGDDSQVPAASPQQKQLRRSSRRRSETVESSSGSQEREEGLPKRDRRKEEDKAGQKKLSQGKGDTSQKQKGIPGKTTDSTKESSQERVAEEWSCKDSAACRALDEEGSRGGRRAEDSPRPEGEGQGSLSTAGQKVERPRYHTRRSSQGLLSSIENSEADSSEGKEESTKKRKTIKVRSRSNSLEGKLKEGQAGSQSLEGSPQGNEIKSAVEANKGDPEVSMGAAEKFLENQEIPAAAAGEAVGSDSSESAGAVQDTSMEQSKGDAPMESLSSPCLSEQEDRAAEESQEEKQSSPGDSAAAANASGAEPSPLQSHECQSKRSKRVKKIKSCDCCFKKPKQQVTEAKFTEPKKEKAELEEPGSSPAQTPGSVSGHSDLEESLALAPCGASTPLHPPKEPSTCSLESQEMALENLEGSSVVVEEENPENPEGSAAETTESMEEIKEPAEQKEQTEQVLSESDPGEPRESCLDSGEEPAAAEKEEINENGQLEEVPEELSVDSKPEEEEVKELEENQEDKGEAESSAGEPCAVPDQEIKDEVMETEIKVCENIALANTSVDSPLKVEGGPQVQVAESPTSLQARCTWSPSASPSTSILKRGVKRSQEDDCLSPANKIRRVSFANPIFQEGLADDIDRRSPVIRSHSSPSSRSLKILSNMQVRHITTPTKGFLSPGSRTLKFKSSKKCLITEMAKESLPCLTEFVYPALAGCKAPVDTVGDLSTLTALEIKTLPIRSPKVSNVKRALKGYHEQQVKSRVVEESSVLEDAEKPGNDVEEKPLGGDEDKLAADLVEAAPSSEQPPVDLLGQIQALAAQLSPEDLHGYSGRQLFEMQEKLAGMASCILRTLQARWHSPPHEGPE